MITYTYPSDPEERRKRIEVFFKIVELLLEDERVWKEIEILEYMTEKYGYDSKTVYNQIYHLYYLGVIDQINDYGPNIAYYIEDEKRAELKEVIKRRKELEK